MTSTLLLMLLIAGFAILVIGASVRHKPRVTIIETKPDMKDGDDA